MMEGSLRVLVVEDAEADAELIESELRKGGLDCTTVLVQTEEKYRRALEYFKPDVILSDYEMPGFKGSSALAIAILEQPDVPFIFVSGIISEDFAVDMLRAGATDYVMKDKLSRLAPTVKRALEAAEEHRGRRMAEVVLEENVVRLRTLLGQTVDILASVVEIRDPYTAGHQDRVARLAVAIAKKLGIEGETLEGIYVAGLLHDVGKIALPTEILSKPGILTAPEYELVKTHPETSFLILGTVDFPWPVAEIALQHHERLDGSGYPSGLTAENIIKGAKIIAVADVVEAMCFNRSFRNALGVQKALDEMRRGVGTLYDPDCVQACIDLFDDDEFRWESSIHLQEAWAHLQVS